MEHSNANAPAREEPSRRHTILPRHGLSSPVTEGAISGVVGAIASAIPAVLLSALKRPDFVVVLATVIVCLSVAFSCYFIISHRYSYRNLPAPPKNAAVLDNIRQVAEEYIKWRQELAVNIYTALWQRANPMEPLKPEALLITLKTGKLDHISGFSDEYLLGVINEISTLRLVPKLQHVAEGYYLLGDDFELNRSTSSRSKSLIAARAMQYVTSGMSIALDGGTTTMELARKIAEATTTGQLQGLRVALTSLQACTELTRTRQCIEAISNGRLTVWLIGGSIEAASRSTEPMSEVNLPWAIDIRSSAPTLLPSRILSAHTSAREHQTTSHYGNQKKSSYWQITARLANG